MSRTIRSEMLPAGFTEILRSTVGSELHGMAIAGTDDHDEMGVCIEPPEYVIGLRTFEQVQWRTQPEGVRSGPGDTDRVIYSLRKYVRLALGGNPTVLLPLYAPEDALLVRSMLGDELRDLAPKMLSRTRLCKTFGGYMAQQRARMERSLATPGEGHHVPNRPELVAAHGYDTKYAAHIIRLGYEGYTLLATGKMVLPLPDHQRERCLAIRRGEVPAEEVLREAASLLEAIDTQASFGAALPDHADEGYVERWLIDAYRRTWAGGSVGDQEDAGR